MKLNNKLTILISTILLVSCDIKNNPISHDIYSNTQIKDTIKNENKALSTIELPKQKNIDTTRIDNYNYSPYISIDSNGNGLLIYTGRYRKVNNYKVQTQEYNFDINSSKEKITLNKNGDGFIVYERVNGDKARPEGSEESFYFTLRSIKNFEIQNTDIETTNKVYESPYINIDDNNNGYLLSLNPEASYDFADRMIFNRFFQFNNTVSLRKIENGIIQKESKNIGSIPSKFDNIHLDSNGNGSLFDFGIYISSKEQFKNLTGQEMTAEFDSQSEGFLDFSRVNFNNFNIDKPILLKTFLEKKNTKLFIKNIGNNSSNLIRLKFDGNILLSKFENDKEIIKDLDLGNVYKFLKIEQDSGSNTYSDTTITDYEIDKNGNGFIILNAETGSNIQNCTVQLIKISNFKLDTTNLLKDNCGVYKQLVSIDKNGNGIVLIRNTNEKINIVRIKDFIPSPD